MLLLDPNNEEKKHQIDLEIVDQFCSDLNWFELMGRILFYFILFFYFFFFAVLEIEVELRSRVKWVLLDY